MLVIGVVLSLCCFAPPNLPPPQVRRHTSRNRPAWRRRLPRPAPTRGGGTHPRRRKLPGACQDHRAHGIASAARATPPTMCSTATTAAPVAGSEHIPEPRARALGRRAAGGHRSLPMRRSRAQYRRYAEIQYVERGARAARYRRGDQPEKTYWRDASGTTKLIDVQPRNCRGDSERPAAVLHRGEPRNPKRKGETMLAAPVSLIVEPLRPGGALMLRWPPSLPGCGGQPQRAGRQPSAIPWRARCALRSSPGSPAVLVDDQSCGGSGGAESAHRSSGRAPQKKRSRKADQHRARIAAGGRHRDRGAKQADPDNGSTRASP